MNKMNVDEWNEKKRCRWKICVWIKKMSVNEWDECW